MVVDDPALLAEAVATWTVGSVFGCTELVLDLDPALWPAAFYLAVCHEALGQLQEAAREYRHVVRVAARGGALALPRRHSAWHQDLLELARKRAGSAA